MYTFAWNGKGKKNKIIQFSKFADVKDNLNPDIITVIPTLLNMEKVREILCVCSPEQC